jgi:hypothetical protein
MLFQTSRSLQFTTHKPAMAFLHPGLRRGLILTTPLILSTPFLLRQAYRNPILCDGPDPVSKITSDIRNSYAHESNTPMLKQSGAPNPKAIKQISVGSILGVLGGLGVSVFSKPLAVLIGLGVLLIQVCGIGLIHWIGLSLDMHAPLFLHMPPLRLQCNSKRDDADGSKTVPRNPRHPYCALLVPATAL